MPGSVEREDGILVAAQYGSDAIAGIMTFVLKEDASGARMDVKWAGSSKGTATRRG